MQPELIWTPKKLRQKSTFLFKCFVAWTTNQIICEKSTSQKVTTRIKSISQNVFAKKKHHSKGVCEKKTPLKKYQL